MGKMIKAPVNVQELRRRIYRKAKSDKAHRFWGIFVHVTKIEVLREAYRIAKTNNVTHGIARQSFDDIETKGPETFLAEIGYDLRNGKCQPQANRRVDIPKS